MKKLIRLTPLEPYFFGGEQIFNSDDNVYFSKSKQMLTQTTAFGCLRYLGIINRSDDFKLNDASIKQIGKYSFNFIDNNSFGKIKGISETFIIKEHDKNFSYYVPIPMDYYLYNQKPFDKKNYNYNQFINVDDANDIIDNSNIFNSITKIGIKKQSDDEDKEYFKKEYSSLEDGYSFGFICDVEDDFVFDKEGIVYLGTGKSLFKVDILDAIPLISYEQLLSKHKDDSFYCASDVYLSDKGYSDLFNISSKNHIKMSMHRIFTTTYEPSTSKRYKRGLGINLIGAGSVINNCNRNELMRLLDANSNAKIVGFNQILDNKGGKL